MTDKLQTLDGSAKAQAMAAAAVHEELAGMLSSYCEVMQLLSHKFVEWDSLLTTWEEAAAKK